MRCQECTVITLTKQQYVTYAADESGSAATAECHACISVIDPRCRQCSRLDDENPLMCHLMRTHGSDHQLQAALSEAQAAPIVLKHCWQ